MICRGHGMSSIKTRIGNILRMQMPSVHGFVGWLLEAVTDIRGWPRGTHGCPVHRNRLGKRILKQLQVPSAGLDPRLSGSANSVVSRRSKPLNRWIFRKNLRSLRKQGPMAPAPRRQKKGSLPSQGPGRVKQAGLCSSEIWLPNSKPDSHGLGPAVRPPLASSNNCSKGRNRTVVRETVT